MKCSTQDNNGDESEDESHFTNQTFYFSHKIKDVDVRRNVVEFGRCFCSGSSAGAALRNQMSVKYAEGLSEA